VCLPIVSRPQKYFFIFSFVVCGNGFTKFDFRVWPSRVLSVQGWLSNLCVYQ